MALAVVLLASALTLGCDWRPGSAASETPSSGKAKTPPPPAPGQADMVAAFSANRAQAGLVDLKFSLKKRPVVGEPVDIDLALIPSVQLEGLFARFQVADGLQLVEGAETQHLERPAANVPISHKLTVIARADGIYYITAVVLADSDKESIARTFSIPIIAGQGLAELPAAPPAASVADPKRAPARP
ncbi:MAG: hypothetical protein WDO56_22010 [Gammaproteobacteria bacterium]